MIITNNMAPETPKWQISFISMGLPPNAWGTLRAVTAKNATLTETTNRHVATEFGVRSALAGTIIGQFLDGH